MSSQPFLSRRDFIASSALLALGLAGGESTGAVTPSEPIIDIHQHTHYSGRSDQQLLAHQRAMGISKTVLLPAGSLYGLAAECGGNDTVAKLANQFPEEYTFFANEVADLPIARRVIESWLKRGAIGIGEQKFHVNCDSTYIQTLAELARDYKVPMLLHFQHDAYNLHLEHFHRILEQFPSVNFIGHAQTWWANIDKNHTDQTILYPKGAVTPGGITDRLLSDYPNMFGDLSAGSGLNALLRDEDHARGFLHRHQDKLVYGSDCNDTIGRGPGCQGSQTIAAVRRLAGSKAVERKLFFHNAKRLMRV